MADETIVAEQPTVAQEQSPMIDIWGNEVKQEETKVDETKTDVGTAAAATTTATTETKVEETKVEEIVVDANVHLKNTLGYDDWDAAKRDIEEYRRLKEKPAQEEIKFANDEAKRMYEALLAGKDDDVYSFLEQKKTFQKAENLNVEEAAQAAQLLQLSYQLKYKDLSQKEVYELFDEQYSKPDKPKQELGESDEEHQMKMSQWQARCEAIDRKIVRDAKIARPDVLKLKSEIVLPDILKQPQTQEAAQKQPTPEEMAATAKLRNEWAEAAKNTVGTFNGFSTNVKYKDGDKEVSFPVSYGLSNEQKTTVIGMVNEFVTSGFDPLTLFKTRWVNADGTDNIQQVIKDLSRVLYGEEVEQKVANEAANQRLELYLKGKKNINVNETSASGSMSVGDDGKTESQKIADAVWG